MKNPTSGALIRHAERRTWQHSTVMSSSTAGWEVKTQGNPLTHTILRGAVNKHDQCLPNYHYEDLKLLFMTSTTSVI